MLEQPRLQPPAVRRLPIQRMHASASTKQVHFCNDDYNSSACLKAMIDMHVQTCTCNPHTSLRYYLHRRCVAFREPRHHSLHHP